MEDQMDKHFAAGRGGGVGVRFKGRESRTEAAPVF